MSIETLQKEYNDCWMANKGEIICKLHDLGFIDLDNTVNQYPILMISGNVIIGKEKRPTKTEIKIYNLKHEMKLDNGFLIKK